MSSMSKNIALFLMLVVAVRMVRPSEVSAYELYEDCKTCHGEFDDGTSPAGTEFPSDNKHTMHRDSSYMDTDCELCHTKGGRSNVYIGSSDGTEANPIGYGCVGCHGRLEDAGNDSLSAGLGAGLRQHHDNNDVTICGACHQDADPSNYTPIGEDVFPPYFSTVDTLADSPCNLVAQSNLNENWSVGAGEFTGLDNDGNNLYDGVDPACVPEPGFGLMAGSALLVVAALRRRARS
jgi:hypothetical protein